MQVSGETNLLQRTRMVFYGFILFVTVGNMPALLLPETSTEFRFLALGMLIALNMWFFYGFRSREYPIFAELWELPALFLLGLGFSDPLQSIGFINAATLYRQLYGPVPLAIVRQIGYVAVAFLIFQFNPAASGLPPASAIGGMATAMILFAVLSRLLLFSLQQYERGATREREVNLACTQLIFSETEDDIYRSLVRPIAAIMNCTETGSKVLVVEKVSAEKLQVLDVAPAGSSGVLGATIPMSVVDASDRRGLMRIVNWNDQVVKELQCPTGKNYDDVLFFPFRSNDVINGGFFVYGPKKLVQQSMDALVAVSSSANLAMNVIRSNQRFASLIKNSNDVITILDAKGIVRYQSAASERLFGYDPSEIVNTPLLDKIDDEYHESFKEMLDSIKHSKGRPVVTEWRWRCKDGRWLYTESITSNLLDDPSVMGIALNTRDISERKQLEEKLRHQATHDPLTKLANRMMFTERVAAAVSRAKRFAKPSALVYIDLDDFKIANDSYGHKAGDALLVTMADILHASVRGFDTAARLGGDEFALLLEELSDVRDAEEVAKRILEAIETPVSIEGSELYLKASIGIAGLTAQDTLESIMDKADTAMYYSKRTGKNCCTVYQPDMEINKAMQQRMKK